MTKQSPGSRHRQRGAIGLVGVITLLMALLFTALVVDTGRLWMQHRHLQTVADIASIQASRQLGCGVVLANVVQAAQSAAVANGYTGNLANNPNIVDIVNVSTVSGIRQFTTGGTEAVRVYATREVPASLVAGGLIGGTVVLNAEAVSRADPAIAAFSAGTFAARIDTENSVLLNAILGEILGSSLSLDVLSYKGIAATHITLNELLQASGQVGGLESLLNTSMSLSQLVSLTSTAVSQSGTASADAQLGMQQLATAAVDNTSITLGSVLDITTPDEEAAGKVGINALSLITAAALIANGNSALSLPLGVSVPGITNIDAQINVIQPPKIAIGPIGGGDGTICTTLSTAQVDARVDVDTNVLGIADIDLSLRAQVAQGTAGLSSISMGDGTAQVTIEAQPGIASIDLTDATGTKGALIAATLPLLGYVDIAELTMDIPVQPSATESLVFDVDYPVADNLPQTQAVDSPLGDSLANALNAPIQVTTLVNNVLVNALVNSILSQVVTPVVKPLITEIGRVFLEPLLEMLGIQLGGMDVTLQGIQVRQAEPLII
jgi:uncharacterized membrane protein